MPCLGIRKRLSQTLVCTALILFASHALAEDDHRSKADLIIGGDFVVTMDELQPIIENGAVAVEGGRIVGVGSADEIRGRYRARSYLSGKDRVLMPGLVNGHSHVAMVLFRGLADDLDLNTWLFDFIFPAEGMFVDEEFIRVGTQLGCWEMIRGGTTTFVDMYFLPDVAAEVVDECGLRAVIAPSSIDFPSPGFQGWDDSFAAAVDFANRWKGRHERIIPAIGVHAPNTVSPDHLVEAIEAADELDVPISIHVAETSAEVDFTTTNYGNPPVKHLDSLGFLKPRIIAAHMVWPNPEEIQLLAQRGAGVIHNPTSNLKLASGISPVPQMLAAGVKMGLATDGATSNNDLDMWEEMHLAALIHKGNQLDPTTMSAQTVLHMATSGGAEAIGLGDEIGAITVGRRADLIQVQLDDSPRLTPLYNVVSHLVYAANSDDVETVVVNGKILMRRGRVRTVNIRDVREKADALAKKIGAAILSQ